MSDSEHSEGSDQQYTVVDQIDEENNRRKSKFNHRSYLMKSYSFSGTARRRDTKISKKSATAEYDSEEEPSASANNASSHSRYEEDDDYHEPNRKKRGKSSLGSSSGVEKKSKSKSHRSSKSGGKHDVSEDENTLDESMLDESKERSVPPLKIKLPPREKSKRSSKRRGEIEDLGDLEGEINNDEDEYDGNVASSSRSSKSRSAPVPPLAQQDADQSGPTRRSERIFVSTTKKVDEFEESPVSPEENFKIIHKDYCQGCRQGGELILCDYCPRAYHKVCLDDELEELPDDWCCPHCEKNGKPDPKELRQQQEALIAKKKKKQQKESQKAVPGKVIRKEIENHDYCEICSQCGELLLCDTCPRAYHLVCIDQDMKIPSGSWSCPYCEENGVDPSILEAAAAVPEEKPEKVEKVICKTCRQGGDVLECANCQTRVHAGCLNPPLEEVPEVWNCVACSVEPLKGKVQRILTWRWKKPDKDQLDKEKNVQSTAEDDTKNLLKSLKNRKPREREFFVKWKDMSYWHCSWVDENQMQVFHSNLHRFYSSKNDMSNAPAYEDASGLIVHELPATKDDGGSISTPDLNMGDQGIAASVAAKHRRQKRCHNLSPEVEDTYLRYNIRPEWLQIHRIINHRRVRNKQFYIIKWRDLGYDEVTAENEPENCDFEFPEYQKKIDEYWDLKKLVEEETAAVEEIEHSKHSKKHKDSKHKKDKKNKKCSSLFQPKTDPKKKWEEQPDYIPEPLKLHDYQKEGISWLRYSWSSNIDVILADEMGLGKTIQTVVFLYSLYKEGHTRGPFLIAAPLSTIINWERELEDWAPDFYVVNYTGNKESRVIMRENEFSFENDAVRSSAKATRLRKNAPVKFHVLLTSYELINFDSALLQSIDWKVLVVDEAHRLKSNQSLFFRTLNQYNVAHKLLLTGTPLQNNLEELFNLLNFLSPNRFRLVVIFLIPILSLPIFCTVTWKGFSVNLLRLPKKNKLKSCTSC